MLEAERAERRAGIAGTAWPLFVARVVSAIAIGLGLTLIHLVGIPVTNTSMNPARSTGPALFVGGWALAHLWLFWVAPLIGGVLGGVLYHCSVRNPRPR